MILQIKDHLIKKAVRFIGGQKYLSVQFDITNACNLSCAHCYHPHHKNNGALNFEQWKTILNQYQGLLNKLYLDPSIIICGGEPFTSSFLFDFLDEAENRWPNVNISVLTNGTRLNEVVVKKLKKYNITVQVSLDGAFEKTHDEIRGEGSFKKAIDGISLLRAHNVKIVIQSVLSGNTSSQIEDFFQLAKMLKVNAMNFTRLIPTGNGQKFVNSGADSTLSFLFLYNAMKDIVKFSKMYQVPTNTDQPLYCLIDEKLGASGKFGFQGLVIDYKGNLKVSSRTNFILGNLLQDSFENIFFNHTLLQDLRNKKKSECGDCVFYDKCAGNRNLSYALSGSFLEKDPSCWFKQQNKVYGVEI